MNIGLDPLFPGLTLRLVVFISYKLAAMQLQTDRDANITYLTYRHLRFRLINASLVSVSSPGVPKVSVARSPTTRCRQISARNGYDAKRAVLTFGRSIARAWYQWRLRRSKSIGLSIHRRKVIVLKISLTFSSYNNTCL